MEVNSKEAHSNQNKWLTSDSHEALLIPLFVILTKIRIFMHKIGTQPILDRAVFEAKFEQN